MQTVQTTEPSVNRFSGSPTQSLDSLSLHTSLSTSAQLSNAERSRLVLNELSKAFDREQVSTLGHLLKLVKTNCRESLQVKLENEESLYRPSLEAAAALDGRSALHFSVERSDGQGVWKKIPLVAGSHCLVFRKKNSDSIYIAHNINADTLGFSETPTEGSRPMVCVNEKGFVDPGGRFEIVKVFPKRSPQELAVIMNEFNKDGGISRKAFLARGVCIGGESLNGDDVLLSIIGLRLVQGERSEFLAAANHVLFDITLKGGQSAKREEIRSGFVTQGLPVVYMSTGRFGRQTFRIPKALYAKDDYKLKIVQML